MDDVRIAQIVQRVLKEFQGQGQGGGSVAAQPTPPPRTAPTAAQTVPVVAPSGGDSGIFGDIEDAINAAVAAQGQLVSLGMETRKKIVESIRQTCRSESRRLAELAVSDTNMGRVDHKEIKNLLAVEKTPGTEELTTECMTGDLGMTFVEYAPFGVIGSITPCTNPTSTIINHAIAMVASGNSVVFGPHPAAIEPSFRRAVPPTC